MCIRCVHYVYVFKGTQRKTSVVTSSLDQDNGITTPDSYTLGTLVSYDGTIRPYQPWFLSTSLLCPSTYNHQVASRSSSPSNTPVPTKSTVVVSTPPLDPGDF